MEPPVALAALVAAFAGLPVVLTGVTRVGRRTLATLRLPVVPRVLVAGAALASMVTTMRPDPATATTPPPILRIDLTGSEATSPPSIADPAERTGARYVVEAGDTLWGIASRLLGARSASTPTSAEIDAYWPGLYEINRDLIGDDPDLIFPGQRLVLPDVKEA